MRIDANMPELLRRMRRLEDAVNPPYLRKMRQFEDAARPSWLGALTATQDAANSRVLNTIHRCDDVANARWLRKSRIHGIAANAPWLKTIRAFRSIPEPKWLRSVTSSPIDPSQYAFGRQHLAFRALQSVSSLARTVPRERIVSAIERAHSSVLGSAIQATALSHPELTELSGEALASLVDLELSVDAPQDTARNKTLLTESIAILQQAVEKDSSGLTNAAVFANAVAKIVACATAPRPATVPAKEKWSEGRIVLFLSILLQLLGILLDAGQLYYARQGELRAEREELAPVTKDADRSEAERTNENLEKLVELYQIALAECSVPKKDPVSGDAHTIFVVTRAVVLRERRSKSSRRLVTLFPYDFVASNEQVGNWVRVTKFDHLSGNALDGWILKKYVRRVTR